MLTSESIQRMIQKSFKYIYQAQCDTIQEEDDIFKSNIQTSEEIN